METNRDDDEDAMVLFRQLRLWYKARFGHFDTFSRLLSLSANQACLVKGKVFMLTPSKRDLKLI